jgi:hypothetical protein
MPLSHLTVQKSSRTPQKSRFVAALVKSLDSSKGVYQDEETNERVIDVNEAMGLDKKMPSTEGMQTPVFKQVVEKPPVITDSETKQPK